MISLHPVAVINKRLSHLSICTFEKSGLIRSDGRLCAGFILNCEYNNHFSRASIGLYLMRVSKQNICGVWRRIEKNKRVPINIYFWC